AVASGAAQACSSLTIDRELELEVVPPARSLRFGVDAALPERIIQPVLENACRDGSTQVRIDIRNENSHIVYAVEDDGAGVAADERERIFEPGIRGTAPRAGEQGAGLGLALARRLARTIDGDVLAETPATGGRFLIILPAA